MTTVYTGPVMGGPLDGQIKAEPSSRFRVAVFSPWNGKTEDVWYHWRFGVWVVQGRAATEDTP